MSAFGVVADRSDLRLLDAAVIEVDARLAQDSRARNGHPFHHRPRSRHLTERPEERDRPGRVAADVQVAAHARRLREHACTPLRLVGISSSISRVSEVEGLVDDTSTTETSRRP